MEAIRILLAIWILVYCSACWIATLVGLSSAMAGLKREPGYPLWVPSNWLFFTAVFAIAPFLMAAAFAGKGEEFLEEIADLVYGDHRRHEPGEKPCDPG